MTKELEQLAREFSESLPKCFLDSIGATPGGLNPHPDSTKVHFNLGKLDCNCEFYRDAYGQVHFVLKASSKEGAVKLSDKRIFSNREVDNSYYLSNRRLLDSEDGSVSADCRIKRRVPDPASRRALYADIVRYLVRDVACASSNHST